MSTQGAPPVKEPSLDLTFGALEIGAFLSVFLLGVVMMQIASYYRNFPKDSIGLKLLVAIVLVLETAHTMLVTHTAYRTTITLYGHPEKLGKMSTLLVSITIEGLICLAVQGYFILRLWRILKNKLLTAFCCVLSLAKLMGCIASTVASFTSTSIAEYEAKWSWLTTSGLVVGAVLDVVIAVALCWYFHKQRNDSMKSSVRLLDNLIKWTLQTGFITSVGSLSMTIAEQTMPDNLIWLGIFMFLAKLYSISLLAMLNARTKFREALVHNTTDFASHELHTHNINTTPNLVFSDGQPSSRDSEFPSINEKKRAAWDSEKSVESRSDSKSQLDQQPSLV